MNKIYITTSIPYVNAAPHVGFALELVRPTPMPAISGFSATTSGSSAEPTTTA